MDLKLLSQTQVDFLLEQYDLNPEPASKLLDEVDPSVRRMVAASTKAPVAFLVQLAFDVDMDVRKQVLRNSRTPQKTKERLLKTIG